ncbi:alpha-1 3-mannosyltransferase, partial [Clonorchis sinensis]
MFTSFQLFLDIPFQDTEIDWIAYMQEVEGFVNGTLDYDKLEGQTGPCVYPAGFLYIYWMLYQITSRGTLIYLAQYIFIGFYLLTLVLVFNIYRLSCQVPPYVFVFMCVISYRIHSIYVLRLFNDPLAMIALYTCVNFLLYGKFTLACIFFSLGVSIKMNILLFAPGLFLILLYYRGILETAGHLCECIIVQLVLGAPFLFHNYEAYISRAFNFGRQFMYKWTVNWRIIPEDVFLDRRYRGGFSEFLKLQIPPDRDPRKDISGIIYPMFLSNFIGVTFSRSLHYQFYVWYFHTIPYLLWTTCLPSSPL